MNQLANIDTDLFVVVSELPTEDIKEGKIYCIKDTSSTAQDNNYIEYAYINNKWEKVGEFKAEPDLDDYAMLNSNVSFNKIRTLGQEGYALMVGGNAFVRTLVVDSLKSSVNSNSFTAFATNGILVGIGTPEDLIFTLEDGTKVTKSIRVISTTTSQNVGNNNGGNNNGGEDGE